MSNTAKRFPVFRSDEEAERFVEEADLSEYDFRDFVPLSEWEKRRKAGRPPLGDKAKQSISLRLDRDVIAAFKATGKGWQSRVNEVLRSSQPVARPAAKARAVPIPTARPAVSAAKVAKPAAAKAAAKVAAAKAVSKAVPSRQKPKSVSKKG